MSFDLKFYASVKDFKLKLRDLERFGLAMRSFEGQDVEVIVRKERSSKSYRQLKFVHGVVFTLISEHTGYDVKDTKALLKDHFLKYAVTLKDGKEIMVTKSLADLTVDEMSKFIDDCVRIAATHWQLHIPDPSQIDY